MKTKRLKPRRPVIPATDILRTSSTCYFVRKPSQVVESLFLHEGTASGTFKVTAGGILFSNLQGEPFAFLVANRHGERFFVSCSRSEPDGGRIRYMYCTMERDEETLGLPSSLMARHGLAETLWNQYGKTPANPATV